jgi:hypothetical protein
VFCVGFGWGSVNEGTQFVIAGEGVCCWAVLTCKENAGVHTPQSAYANTRGGQRGADCPSPCDGIY